MSNEVQDRTKWDYIAIGPNYWGRGKALNTALINLRKEGYKGKEYVVYHVHPDSQVDEVTGGICFPTGEAPSLVADTRKKKTT